MRHYLRFVLAFIPSLISGAACDTCAPASSCSACTGMGAEFNYNDTPFIKELTASKRTIDLDEKGKGLRISGDIRTDWLFRTERLGLTNLRGNGATDRLNRPIPPDEMAVRFNFKLDYKCNDFYALCQIEWDDVMGIFTDVRECSTADGNPFVPELLFGSGSADYLCLKRMYMGMTLWKCEDKKIWLELGRKSLYYTFDSRIQYKARVDGIFGEYSDRYAKYENDRSSEFAIRGGTFLVDQKSNHFAWAYEARLYNVMDSGIDVKYSMIDWSQRGRNACGARDPLGWRFLNSQVTLDYNFKEKVFGKKLNLYSAALMNHKGKPLDFEFQRDIPDFGIVKGQTLHIGAQNIGWYAGFIIGEVSKAGDISFDFNYQYVEVQAVPDCDNRGIGTGNFRKETFASDSRGNGNYKGFHAELLYAITDRLQIDISCDMSRAIKKFHVGTFNGRHDYNRVDIELIHAF